MAGLQVSSSEHDGLQILGRRVSFQRVNSMSIELTQRAVNHAAVRLLLIRTLSVSNVFDQDHENSI